MVDSLKPLLPLCYLFSRGLNQRMSGQCDAGVELLRARLGGYKRQLYLRHSLEADKSQSLPHEERTLVGLIFPPSWSQRDRRTEKAVLGCVCVLELAQAMPRSPQGKVSVLGLGRMVQTSQKELFELEGVAQKSPRPCAELSEERTVGF